MTARLIRKANRVFGGRPVTLEFRLTGWHDVPLWTATVTDHGVCVGTATGGTARSALKRLLAGSL